MNALPDAELHDIVSRGLEAQDILDAREAAERHREFEALPIEERLFRAVMVSGYVNYHKNRYGEGYRTYKGCRFVTLSDLPFSQPLGAFENVQQAIDDLDEQLAKR